jgi:gluconolactonase
VIVRHGEPFLAQKRVFAYAHAGIPAALACDAAGNLYAACGDGVEIWSPGGVPLGLIVVPVVSNGDAGGGGLFGMGVFWGGGKTGGGGAGNCCCSTLCFGRRPGELFVGAGQRLWWVDLDMPQSQKGMGSSEVKMELL